MKDLRYDRWIGEKYDGVRCCWNPEYESMYQIVCSENIQFAYIADTPELEKFYYWKIIFIHIFLKFI